MNIVQRYAHRLLIGDFSQGLAFWAILVPSLLFLKFSIAMLSLMNVISDPVLSTRIWLPVAIFVFLILVPLLFIATYRSVWISAQKFKGGRQSLLLFVVTTYLAGMVITELVQNRTYFSNMAQIAMKQDAMTLDIDARDQRLILTGALGYDSTERVRQALEQQQPPIQTVELNLSGGHLHEARRLASLIIETGLNTEVREECSGTCMLVLVSGRERTAWRGAQLRFHRTTGYDNGYRSDWVIERERYSDRQYYRRRGVAEAYLYPIYYTQKNDAYLEPGLDVLLNYRVLTKLAE